jgi:selenocysteine lyase/cysteine desulfurase
MKKLSNKQKKKLMMINRVHKPKGIYLLSHSVGPRPIENPTVKRYESLWQDLGGDAWKHWPGIIEGFLSELATLFNAESSEFCPQTNITSGLCKILTCMGKPVAGKNKILLSERDFPSLGFAFEKFLSADYEIVYISADEDISELSTWEKYITDDIALSLITFCTSHSSQRSPVKDIIKLCKKHDVTSIVDVAHAAGIVPVDLKEWDCDFVLGSCVKWLCGGSGAGYLWINKNITSKWNPKDVGWFSHENPFEFDIHNFRYAKDAKKFWGSTPSIAPYAQAKDSIAMINELGVENLIEHNYKLNALMIKTITESDKASEFIIKSHKDFEKSGGTLLIEFKNKATQEKLLAMENIYIDACANGVRISPHFYNTEEEIINFCNTLLNI